MSIARLWLMAAAVGLAACSGKDGAEGDDSGADDSGGGTDDGVSPTITVADAWCYEHTVGDTAWVWSIKASADDPQGTETLESFVTDGILVKSGDSVVSTQAIVCAEDGACSGSFTESSTGIACSAASSYTFVLAVEDEDGNRSDEYSMSGRQGSDSEG